MRISDWSSDVCSSDLVGSQIDWGLQFGTIAPRPAFEAYAAGLRERAAYKRAKDIDNGLIAEMQAAGRAASPSPETRQPSRLARRGGRAVGQDRRGGPSRGRKPAAGQRWGELRVGKRAVSTWRPRGSSKNKH